VASSYQPNVNHTPPAPRLRLLLVGGVSFTFSFQLLLGLAVFGTFESMCFYHCGTGGRRLLIYTYPSTINFE